jgi:hypothetical protein
VGIVLTTNHLYAVAMFVDAAAAATDAGARSRASAFVDPFFVLGPGIDPARYSFHFSEGIGNAPPSVPEPGRGWLMACGLLGLGAIRAWRLKPGPRHFAGCQLAPPQLTKSLVAIEFSGDHATR